MPCTDSSASVVYLSLETRRTAFEVGGWYPEKLGVSVAIALTSNRLHIFTEKDIGKLAALLAAAECVIGYNVVDFDFKVLAGCRGANLENVRCLDLMKNIESAAGRRVSLGSLRTATLKTAQVSNGLENVQLWKKRQIAKVIEDCCNTVLAIKALHEYGRDHDELFYSRDNGPRRKRIKVNWDHPKREQA